MTIFQNIDLETLANLSDNDKADLLALIDAKQGRDAQKLFHNLFPDSDTIWDGPSLMGGLIESGQTIHGRDKYARHLEFFRSGSDYIERCFMAANRVGKTFSAGGFEVAAHLTGIYPDWWEGRKFSQPISAWAAGDYNESTRDIIQPILLGEITSISNRKTVNGRGVIPGEMIDQLSVRWKSGVPDMVDTIKIKHVSGGRSTLGLKSFDQGRKAFQGTSRHVIWLDEEPPSDVYDECLLRTTTVNGLVMLTFTPLSGMTIRS